MANPSSNFFYWYRRYKVRAADMNNFQTALSDGPRGTSEGLLGAAVLKGGSVTPAGGMVVDISETIATAATGYLSVVNVVTALDLTPATANLPTRSLIVITAEPTDANFITSPTDPFTSVPLNSLQQAGIVLLPGTPSANPDYPAKGPNDVILCGVKLLPGVTGIDPSMLDFEVRDSVGVNSLIAQNQVRFDDRLRPYRASPTVVGIKPSQTVSGAVGFSFPGKSTPSVFPLTGGVYTPEDTFVDFSTGLISGGDDTSVGFAPPAISAGNSVVCIVQLTTNDTLAFKFGIDGTYDQCLAAMVNQTTSGPGSLPTVTNSIISYVIITAYGGVISDVQVFDARGFLGGGGGGGGGGTWKGEVPQATATPGLYNISQLPTSQESCFINVGTVPLQDTDFTLTGTQFQITNAALIPDPVNGPGIYIRYQYNAATASTPIGYIPHGTPQNPIVVDLSGSVPGFGAPLETIWLGTSAASGGQAVSGSPQIAPGNIGDVKKLKGPASGGFLIFNPGNGVIAPGTVYLMPGQTWEISFDGSNWTEDSRCF